MVQNYTNDWMVSGLNNPSKSTYDFVNFGGFTTENTQFLSREEYLQKSFIKNHPMFKDDNGKFSLDKFNNYYNMRAYEYGQFQRGEFYNGPALDLFNSGPTGAPTLDIGLTIRMDPYNPYNQAKGVAGPFTWTESEGSIREFAQKNKVYNTTTGVWENYTPNDHALTVSPLQWLKDFYRDPLVLATWDEDGTSLDPVTGADVEHKKGDVKLDDNGHPYYETLGNRSDIGKQILPFWDVLTVDGRGLNCIDFFDSDDLNKTASGCISRAIAVAAPLFFGNKVKNGYAIVNIVKDLLEEVPMFEGLLTGGDPFNGNQTVNAIAARTKRFDLSASDYSQEHMISFENISSVVGDVALQLTGQQMIANGLGRVSGASRRLQAAERRAKEFAEAKLATEGFRGDPKAVYDAARMMYVAPAEAAAQKAWQLGADISIAYMVSSQAREVYEDAISHGTTRREASIMALGSMIGMYTVDKYLGLGELFLKAPGLQKDVTRAVSNEIMDMRMIYNGTARRSEVGLLSRTSDKVKNFYTKYRNDIKNHTLPFAAKVIGEGFEEMGEELMSDMSKQIYQWIGSAGLFDTTVKDVGAWDQAGERYFMNFIGGALGGAIFAGSDAFRNRGKHDQITDRKMIDLIVNGHAQLLYDELDRQHARGRTGSKTLSLESSIDNKGNRVWLTTTNPEESQAHHTYQAIKNEIARTEAILQVNKDLALSDDELFKRLYATAHIANNYERFIEIADMARYKEKYRSLLGNLADAEASLSAAENTIEGVPDGIPKPSDPNSRLDPAQQQDRNKNLDKLRATVEEKREAIRTFLSAETSADYVRMIGAMIDPMVFSAFFSTDDYKKISEIAGEILKKNITENSGENKTDTEQAIQRLNARITAINKAKLSYLSANFETLWRRFKSIEPYITPFLNELQNLSPTYRAQLEEINKILDSSNFSNQIKNGTYVYKYDTRLDDETDEEYEHRNKKYDNESDEDFESRKEIRALKLDAVFANEILEVLNKSGNNTLSLDEQAMSRIKTILPRQIKNIFLSNLRATLTNFRNNQEVYAAVYHIMQNFDLKDTDKIEKELKNEILKIFMADASAIANNIYDHVLSDGKTMGDYALVIFDNIDNDNATDFLLLDPEKRSFPALSEITAFNGIDDNIKQEIYDYVFKNIIQYVNASTTHLSDIFTSSTLLSSKILESICKPYQDHYLADFYETLFKSRDNKLYKLYTEVSNNAYNPIVQLIKDFAEIENENGEKILLDISALFTLLENNFQVQDINDITLGQDVVDNLTRARDVINLVAAYIRMAGAETNGADIMGHNKAINEYIRQNKKRLKGEWKNLPELDTHDYLVYEKTLQQYDQSIEFWLNIGKNSAYNKIRKINTINSVFFREMYSLIKTVAHISVILPNGLSENVNLLEGIEAINENNLDNNHGEPIVPFEHIARILHDNVSKLAQKMKTTVSGLLVNHGLLSHLVSNFDQITDSSVTELNEDFKASEMNPYSKAIFYTTILLGDTQEFFKNLRDFYTANDNIIPMADQLFNRFIISTAQNNPEFFKVIQHVFEINKANIKGEFLSNVIFSEAPAGGGKTTVLASSATQSVNDDQLIVCAPNEEQVSKLRDNIGKGKGMTISEFLKTIIDETQLQEIEEEIEKNKDNVGTKAYTYFSITYDSRQLTKVTFNDINSIKWKNNNSVPSLLVIDEAIDMNTVEGILISEWAKRNGVIVHMLGDVLQNGYAEDLMQNLGVGSVFSLRTFAMSMSLREANMQKTYNLNAIRTILLNMQESFLHDSEAVFVNKFQIWKNALKAVNLRACLADGVLNGEHIVDNLDAFYISRLKSLDKGGNIAFIGSDNSRFLKSLKDAGINPKVYNVKDVKSQEFDYVIIDYDFDDYVVTSWNLYLLTKNLYTLMSRSRYGSIIISDKLQDYIGHNEMQGATGQAISLTMIRDNVRPNMLKYINQIITPEQTIDQGQNTDTETANPVDEVVQPEGRETTEQPEKVGQQDNTTTNDESSVEEEQLIGGESSPEITPDINPDNILNDPDESTEANHKPVSEDNIDNSQIIIGALDNLDDFPVMCYGDIALPGAVFIKNKGWQYDSSGNVVRNLAGLIVSPAVAQQSDAINLLHQTRGVIKYYKGDYDKLPKSVQDLINRKDWDDGVYEVEFRKVTENDSFLPGQGLKEVGFEVDVNGTKQRVIGEIVFTVKRKDGKTLKIDLGALNAPNTLKQRRTLIESNLMARINKAKDSDLRKSLQKKLAGITDERVNQYTNWFNSMAMQAATSSDGTVAKQINNIFFNQTTWITRNETDEPIVGRDIIRKHPNFTFSSVYVCTNNSDEFETNINPSMAGRFVVFCAPKELGLSGDELVARYKEQKLKQGTSEEIYPWVRMLVINPNDLSFLEWTRSTYKEEIHSNMVSIIPRTFLGARMFTAMWNARASLLNLKKALDDFCQDYNITNQEHIQQLIRGARFIDEDPAKFKSAEAEVRSAIENYGFTEEQLRAFKQKFANDYCKDIPMFRLYYHDTTREIEVPQGSTAYSGQKKVRVWCININSLNQYTNILNEILTQINNLIVNNNPFNISENSYIDYDNANHRRSLSGLMSVDQNSNIVIQDVENNQKLTIPANGTWGAIPYLVCRVVDTMRTRHVYKKAGAQLPDDAIVDFNYSVHQGKGRPVIRKTLSFNISAFENYGATLRILEGVITGRMIHTRNANDKSVGNFDEFYADTKNPPLTDPYFKHGIQTPPTLLRSNSEIINENQEYIRPEDTGTKNRSWFYRVNATLEQFTLDHAVRISGVELSLSELIGEKQNAEPIQPDQNSGESNNNQPEISRANSIQEVSDIIDDAIGYVNAKVKNASIDLTVNVQSISNYLNRLKNNCVSNDMSAAFSELSEMLEDDSIISLIQGDPEFAKRINIISEKTINLVNNSC